MAEGGHVHRPQPPLHFPESEIAHVFEASCAASLETLPNELLLLILDLLHPLAILSLSLTNKAWRQTLSPRIQDDPSYHDAGFKIEFLQILERDLPDFIICHLDCQKLYNWRSVSHRANCAFIPYRVGETSLFCTDSDRIPFFGDFCLDYQTVELLTRHAELGPEFGLPLKYLVQSLKECSSSQSPLNPPDIKVKIVSHRLLVQYKYRIRIKVQETRTFASIRKQINDLYDKGCPHTHDSLATLCECAVLDLMQSDLSNIKLKCIDCQEPRYCDECSTDFRVKATRNSETDEISLTATIWKDLGPRRTRCSHPSGEHPPNTHSQCQNYYNEAHPLGQRDTPGSGCCLWFRNLPSKDSSQTPHGASAFARGAARHSLASFRRPLPTDTKKLASVCFWWSHAGTPTSCLRAE